MRCKIIFSLLILMGLMQASLNAEESNANKPEPLNQAQLTELVKGNTFSGRCHDTKRPFAIYFAPDGTVYLQKAGGPFTRYGTWSITQNRLKTPWPYEDLPTQNQNRWIFYQRRDLRTYYLEFRALPNQYYEPYKVRNCSCDPSPEFAFPPCKWSEGQTSL